jgi:hypothetical protein
MKYEIVMKHFCGLFARTPETSLIDKTGITVTNQGTGYTSVPVITIVGTASTIATATATLETVSAISSIVIDNPGSGYITDPTVTIDPPPGMGITATAKSSIARGNAVQLGARIYVLHAFQKKSKSGIKTPPKDVDLIKQRYKEAKGVGKT